MDACLLINNATTNDGVQEFYGIVGEAASIPSVASAGQHIGLCPVMSWQRGATPLDRFLGHGA